MKLVLLKSYVSGYYRKNKSGAMTFVKPHHNKVMPKHDKPLGHDYEAWKESEIAKHLKQLKAEGKSTSRDGTGSILIQAAKDRQDMVIDAQE